MSPIFPFVYRLRMQNFIIIFILCGRHMWVVISVGCRRAADFGVGSIELVVLVRVWGEGILGLIFDGTGVGRRTRHTAVSPIIKQRVDRHGGCENEKETARSASVSRLRLGIRQERRVAPYCNTQSDRHLTEFALAWAPKLKFWASIVFSSICPRRYSGEGCQPQNGEEGIYDCKRIRVCESLCAVEERNSGEVDEKGNGEPALCREFD